VRPDLLETETGERTARELTTALDSVLRAQNQRYLMANVPKRALPQIREILPGINGPTILDVHGRRRVRGCPRRGGPAGNLSAIARLKEIGAEGILVTRIERLMP
jgi:ATP phosphoribosyltransferase